MSERGQATLEYAGVVALVAAVLVLGTGAASASGIGERVTAQLARGLCVVARGGDCDGDRLPCPVRWRRDLRSVDASVAVARLGGGLLVMREERSDGSVALTLAGELSGGAEAELDQRVAFADVELRAALLSAAGYGRRWVLPDRAAADRVEEGLRAWSRGRRGVLPDLPPADETFHERTPVRVQLTGRLVADGIGVESELGAGVLGGVREHRATGARTVFLRLGGDATARARWRSPRGSASTGARAAASREVAVTFDREGRPVRLVATRTAPWGGVPPEAAGLLPASGGLLVVERRLDLADGANLAAAREALRGRLGALEERLGDHAVVHVRAYEASSRQSGGGVGLPGGVRVGYDHARERARLVGAVTRDLGGGWARRADCA